MSMLSSPRTVPILATLAVISLLLVSCGKESPQVTNPDEAKLLAGTWVLTARIVEGKEAPATGRQMRLVLKQDGTFRADFRGEANQKWTRAGQGAFSYIGPDLTFFWDSCQTGSLLVGDRDADRFRVHHGRNLVPMKEADPDEIFVREEAEKKSERDRS